MSKFSLLFVLFLLHDSVKFPQSIQDVLPISSVYGSLSAFSKNVLQI